MGDPKPDDAWARQAAKELFAWGHLQERAEREILRAHAAGPCGRHETLLATLKITARQLRRERLALAESMRERAAQAAGKALGSMVAAGPAVVAIRALPLDPGGEGDE